MRVRLLPYRKGSKSARLLARELGAKRLKLEGSKFRARQDDVIINWGNSNLTRLPVGTYSLLNFPPKVSIACNKTLTLEALKDAGVSTVEFTTDKREAQQWHLEGSQIYSRAILSGHSGKGITFNKTSENGCEELVEAKLYTKAITGKRREFRVHVFQGKVIHCQTKKRRNGWRELDNYCDEIRNRHTGWIYSLDTEHVTEEMKTLAVNAVKALGLDFGGVDIISKNSKSYVLEINTACGLSNPSTLEAYSKAFKEYLRNR